MNSPTRRSLLLLLINLPLLPYCASLIPAISQSPPAANPNAPFQEKARQRTCLANERQIGFALRLYLQDNDDKFPVQYDHTFPTNAEVASDRVRNSKSGGGPLDPNYYDALTPYLKNRACWFCPDDVGPRADGFMGYHMNGNVITATGFPEASIADESRLMVLRDTGGGTVQNCFLRPMRFPYNNGLDDGFTGKNRGPHANGSYNILFADGHAQPLAPGKAGGVVVQRP